MLYYEIIHLTNLKRRSFQRINVGNELKILDGHGYSPEGKEKLKLCLHETKAGYSFIQQRTFHSGGLTQDPKSSKLYHSLLCVRRDRHIKY